MKKALVLLLSASTLVGLAQDGSQSFTIKQAQDYALKNSYSVIDKELEYKKAKKQILETAAIGLPQISFSADYTNNTQIPGTPVPDGLLGQGLDGQPDIAFFGVEHATNATISLNQLIFDASYIVALKATQVVKDIANLNTEKSKIDIQVEVAKAYHLALVSMENARLAKENVETLKKNLFDVQQLYDNGFMEEQDVDQLEILLLQQESALNSAERQTDLALKLLKFQMGMKVDANIQLSEKINDVLGAGNVDDALVTQTFNMDNHIDFRLIEAQRAAATLQVNNQQNTFYPSLSGFARHTESNFGNDNFNAFQFDRAWIPGTALGVKLQWNLFVGMGRTARIQQAKIDLERVDVAIEATKNQLQLEYKQNLSDYKYALDAYNTQVRSSELSEKVRNKTRIKYMEGISTSLELTQAETQYLTAQISYLQSIVNLLGAKEDLNKTLNQ
jgi:outer membrane protein TolC